MPPIAHAGTELFETIVQLIVFLGPVPVLFYFLMRVALRNDDDDSET